MKAIKTILVILLILFGVFLIIQIQPLIPSSPSAEKEIAAAKKTTRNDNVLGIMLMNLDPTTSWRYFIGDTGAEVVEASGSFPLVYQKEAMEVLMSPAISGSTYRGATIGLDADGELIVTYGGYDHRGVSSINFRIQCIKIKDPQLLQTTSAYNTYRLGYGEIAITDEFGEVETILGAATLLEVIEQLFSSL